MTIKAWLTQPSTILGLGTAAATISGLIVHAITGNISWAAMAGGAAFSLVHVALPDNSAAQSSVEKLVTDAVTAAAQRKLAAAVPLLIQDGMAALNSFVPAPAPVAVPVAVAAVPMAPPVPTVPPVPTALFPTPGPSAPTS